ncbi:transcription regulator HTH, apses-type DNA-binding domain-containing protein, partial [Zopfochytrium polystomum]
MPGVHPPPSTIYTIQPPKPTVVYGASAGISSQSSASSSSTLQTAPKLKAPDVPRGRPPNSAKGTRPAQPVNNPPTVTIGSYRTKLPDSPIYMAVYSGVSVYEKIIRGVPVMKRVDDYYMNATHILKVAGFTKPKRTKILEKEVLQGHHEKVQGGYGKYQGTWIPRQIAKSLAKQYGVDQVLKDIFDYT